MTRCESECTNVRSADPAVGSDSASPGRGISQRSRISTRAAFGSLLALVEESLERQPPRDRDGIESEQEASGVGFETVHLHPRPVPAESAGSVLAPAAGSPRV